MSSETKYRQNEYPIFIHTDTVVLVLTWKIVVVVKDEKEIFVITNH